MTDPTSSPTYQPPARLAGTVTCLICLAVGLVFGSMAMLWRLYDLILGSETLYSWTYPAALGVTWPWWAPPWQVPDPSLAAVGLGALGLAAVVSGLLTWRLLGRAESPAPRRAFWTGWLATVIGAGAAGLLQWAVSALLGDLVLAPRTGVAAVGYALVWGVLAGLLAGCGTMVVVRRARQRDYGGAGESSSMYTP